MEQPVIKVVAAVIEKQGEYLLIRRPKGGFMGGYWEFPGGKIDPGETSPQALVRELREELGVTVEPGRLVETVRHSYPEKRVELEFYEARLTDGDPRLIEPAGIGWFAPEEMPCLPILPADLGVVSRLGGASAPGSGDGAPLSAPADFSWSASRHNQFAECRRAYFFHYYLSLGRALQFDPERKRLAWRLRNLTSLPLWIGSRVHDTVEGLLRAAAAGRESGVETAVEEMVRLMRRDYLESSQGLQLTAPNPKEFTRFFEHEYERPVEAAVWSARVEEAKGMVRTFASGPYLDLARSLSGRPGDLLSIESLDTWSFEGVSVFARLDFAFRDEAGLIHILDWKTSKQEREANPLQMMGYAAMARQRWDAPLEQLRVREIYLRLDGRERPCTLTPASMEQACQTIRSSIRAMVAGLADPEGNRAREADFPLAEPGRVCESCNFRRICPRFAEP